MPSALCSVFLSAWEEEKKKEEEEDVLSRLGGGAAAAAAAAAAAGKGEAGEIETWKPQSARDPAPQASFQLHGQSVETADVPSVRHLLLPPISSSQGKGAPGARAAQARGGARGRPPLPPAELMEGC